MIYFDNNKNAFGYEIPNYTATTTDENWEIFQPLGNLAWDIIDGAFVDNRESAEYQQEQTDKTNLQRINVLKSELQALDIKRIRAMAEPSNKTEEQTWLEFYNAEIYSKRIELINLGGDGF